MGGASVEVVVVEVVEVEVVEVEVVVVVVIVVVGGGGSHAPICAQIGDRSSAQYFGANQDPALSIFPDSPFAPKRMQYSPASMLVQYKHVGRATQAAAQE